MPTDQRILGGLSLADLRGATALARSEVVGIEIGELETITGYEDLTPLLNPLDPVLDILR